MINRIRVGISETIRTQKKIIIKKKISLNDNTLYYEETLNRKNKYEACFNYDPKEKLNKEKQKLKEKYYHSFAVIRSKDLLPEAEAKNSELCGFKVASVLQRKLYAQHLGK